MRGCNLLDSGLQLLLETRIGCARNLEDQRLELPSLPAQALGYGARLPSSASRNSPSHHSERKALMRAPSSRPRRHDLSER